MRATTKVYKLGNHITTIRSIFRNSSIYSHQ